MGWRSVRFDWNRARAFLVTAEEGSLSAAARALGLTQPTLGRQVDALEEELGVVLFERSRQGYVLTPTGAGLLEHVRRMGQAAGDLSLAASGRADAVEAAIRISASEIEAVLVLPPVLARLRDEAPGIEVEMVASDTASNIRRREADIAIRNFRPTDPDLIARKIRDDAARLYGSAALIDRIGRPVTPGAVNAAPFVGFDPPDQYIDGLNRRGLAISVANIKLRSSSMLMHWELVKAGVGLSVIPESVGDGEPGIERVLDDKLEPLAFPVWLTTHRELNTSKRVRFVFEFLADALARPIRVARKVPRGSPR